MAERQRGFAFVPRRGEAVEFARMGLDLNWHRIGLRTGRLFAEHLRQALPESRDAVIACAFGARRHFLDMALMEEIQRCCKQKGRLLKREWRERRGRRLSGGVALIYTPEGRRAQRVIDRLSRRLSAWEAVSLCG